MRSCYFLLVMLICSCGTTKDTANEVEPPTVAPAETAKIGFYNYHISKSAEQLIQVKFIDKIIVNGKLKKDGSVNSNSQKNNLKLIQKDSNNRPLDSIYIENPLSKIVEYVNDDGEFEKRTINLDQAEFSVRLQLNPKTTEIVIYGNDVSTQPLIKHKI